MIDIGEFLPQPLVETLGSVLLHFIWQGALVGIFLCLTLNLLQRHSAQVRSSAALLALISILAFPLATMLWLVVSPPKAVVPAAPEPRLESNTYASAPTLTTTPQREELTSPTPAREFTVNSPSFPLKVSSAPPRTSGTIPLHEILPLLVAVWLTGVIAFSLRFILSWIITQQLRNQATTLAPQALQRALRRLSKSLRVSKPIRLLESGIVNAPVVVGWLSPVILLPSKVVENLSLDKLEPILAHELAHIRRNDWFVIIVQRLAETLFFYHPVVWWLSKLLEKEREYSCDDIAAAACGNPRAYAQALAELEVLRSTEPQFMLAASSGPLLNRVRRLVMASSIKTHAQSPARAIAGSLVMATLFAVIILGFGPKFAFAQAGYNEAPMLAERVAAGELPPVEERLPVNPMVVPVVERIGQYGGTWRTALVGGGDAVWLNRTIGYENLVRWDPEWTNIILNIAESFEVNDEGTVFTFQLRHGMRWSDGYPFTADDILFWYEDVAMNAELSPAGPPGWLVVDGEPVTVDKLDDYTVVFTFAAPHGLFLQHLASGAGSGGGLLTSYPRHYLAQYHATHNPETIDSLVQDAGLNQWVDLFQSRANPWQNAELPRLHGWILNTAYDGTTTKVVAERNPYYWKVDSEGNQLPYLNQVVFDVFEDVEVLLLRALNGEIDMYDRHLGTLSNRAVLFDNMELGNYRFYDVVHSSMNSMMLALNLTHKDPVKREIFNNKDFRIGISHAINRQEIIDLLYLGLAEPWQGAPHPNVPFFHEQLARQYTEYNPELASEHFDRAGYVERDGEGYRLGPDGRRISFTVEVITANDDAIAALGIIQGYLRELGVDMQIRTIDRSLFETRKNANEHDATVWQGDGGMFDAFLDPRWYFPFSNESHYAVAWAYWYQNNPQGEEPPDAAKQQMGLYDQLKSTVDPDRQIELMHEILEVAAEQFYAVGLSRGPNRYGIVKNNFRNVPESMPGSGSPFPNPAATNPVQYFLQQP